MKLPVFLIAIGAIAFVACTQGTEFGAPIPSNAPVAKLAEIFEDPASYQDREFVLEGNYGYYCCPSDFSYREGLEAIGIAPSGFDSPKADRGRPVRIYGVIRLGAIPGEEEAGESEEEAIRRDLYIEAKGVQLK